MAIIVFDWTDFLVKLALLVLFALFFVAGALVGFGVLGLIMRHEYRERRKKRREIRHYKAQTKALFAEVDRILTENRGM